MRYTVTKSVIYVIGRIWMPAVVAARDIELSDYDLRNMMDTYEEPVRISRSDVEEWLSKNAGDFQEIIDFSASLEVNGETVEFDWKDDSSELTYNDCMISGDEGY